MGTLDKTLAPEETFTPAAGSALRPLCVDLDGSLCKSDTLVDSVLALVRYHPKFILQIPAWLALGKAGFKRQIARHVTLDVPHLPWNQPLVDHLYRHAAAGNPVYLATGADESIAQAVIDHFGFFTGVFSSDGQTNLTGERKLRLLQGKFAATGFDYIGNSTTDLPLLTAAHSAALANPSHGLDSRLAKDGHKPVAVYQDKAPIVRTFRKTVRAQQWAKNALLFVPIALAHSSADRPRLYSVVLGFVAFCLAASSTYIVNDLLDIEADRRHPRKRMRPFAAGNLSAVAGIGIIVAFLALAAVLMAVEPWYFDFWLAVYFVTTLGYSLYLKRQPLVDVLILAGLYTVRILAGGAAAQTRISPWLGGFSLFFFLSLAFVKRYSELHNLQVRGAVPTNGRGYLLSDLEQIRSFGTASGIASVVVFTMYINSDAVTPLYHHASRLWLLAPILIFWIFRVWLKAARGHMDEDPVIYAITDRVSLGLGVLTMLVLLGSAY